MFLLFFAATSNAQRISDEATKIEQKAVDNRLKIKSWHVELDYATEFFRADEKHKSQKLFYVNYCEADKRRVDLTQKNLNTSEITSTKQIISDYYYTFFDINCNKPATSKTFTSTVFVQELPDKELYEILPIDIRILGFSPSGILFERQITDILGIANLSPPHDNSDAKYKEVVDEVLDGIACKKTIWKLSKHRTITTWLAKEMNYTPIRMDFKDDESKIYYKTTLKLSQYKKTDIWFPVNSIFEEYENEELILRETVKLNVISLNEKLDKNTFTLRGFDIPKNTRISYLRKSDTMLKPF
jgi:hypothetical protein